MIFTGNMSNDQKRKANMMSKQKEIDERCQTILEDANSAAESAARNQPKKPVLKRGAYTKQQFERDEANFKRQHGGGK